MYIKYQNIRRDENGFIMSGSASLIETSYVKNLRGDRTKHHSKDSVTCRLGEVLWRNETNIHQGIFNSPTHGLVGYDSDKDQFFEVDPNDPRLHGTKHEKRVPRIHSNFGNAFLFFSELEKTVFMNVLRRTFKDQHLYQKVLAHLAHGCLRNGSFIKCGEFLKGSFLPHILTDISISTLDCDSSYFFALHDDELKVKFFTELIKEMRKDYPDFGRACYVDSTPLPGEAEGNPFNALSSHGTECATSQSRLVLVLDIQTNIPIWFNIIPANLLDKSTILTVTADAKATLGIDIDMYDLDAGYAREELFELFNRNNSRYVDEEGILREHTVLVRMPAIKGYPRDELYIRSKPYFYDPDFRFSYEHHTYFGKRYEVDIFEHPMYAFVYIDHTQAESLLRGWEEEHPGEWNKLSRSNKAYYMVKNGFFILLGNKDQSPQEGLIEYRGRTQIETYFRDGKAYLRILPLAKWTKETIAGKIFHDIIEMTIYRAYRKCVAPAGLSMSSLIVRLNSWECFKCNDNTLETTIPQKQVREAMEALGYSTVAHYDLNALRREILEGVAMSRVPAKQKRTRKTEKAPLSLSPEEKAEAAAKEKAQREAEMAAKKKAAEEARAAKKKAAEEARIAKKKATEEARIAKKEAAEEARAAKKKAAEEA